MQTEWCRGAGCAEPATAGTGLPPAWQLPPHPSQPLRGKSSAPLPASKHTSTYGPVSLQGVPDCMHTAQGAPWGSPGTPTEALLGCADMRPQSSLGITWGRQAPLRHTPEARRPVPRGHTFLQSPSRQHLSYRIWHR